MRAALSRWAASHERWLALLLIIYLLTSRHLALTDGGLALLVPAAIALLAKPPWATRPALWGLLAIMLGALAASAPLDRANHHYVLMYACAMLALCDVRASEATRQSARWLFVVVMGVATVQKLLSATMRDGSFLAALISTGGLLQPLWSGLWHGEVAALMRENAHRLESLRALAPEQQVAMLWPYGALRLWGQAASVLTIGAEAALTVWVAARPRSVWTHGALLAFIGGLLLVRQELIFISLVSWLGYACCDGQAPVRLRRAYQLAMLIALSGAALSAWLGR